MTDSLGVEWTKQSFKSLEDFCARAPAKSGLSGKEISLMERYGEIMQMMARDGVWPPSVSPERNRFCAALCETLSRLPQEAFDKVEDNIRFLLDDPSLNMLAINAPAPQSSHLFNKPGIDTIIFFRDSLQLTTKALIGLIALEITYSFISDKNPAQEKTLAASKARQWGFERELACLECEKEKLLGGKRKISG